MDAELATVLSVLDNISTLKEKQRTALKAILRNYIGEGIVKHCVALPLALMGVKCC